MKNVGETNKIKLTVTIDSLLNAQFHIGNNPNFLHPSMDSFILGQINTQERILKERKKKKFQVHTSIRINKKSTKNRSYQSKSLNTFFTQ
jgi:ribosomal protein S2